MMAQNENEKHELKKADLDFKVAESDLFNDEEIALFKDLLLTEKEALLKKSKAAINSGEIQLDTNEMMDEVDLASATIEQNLTFRLLDRDRQQLNEVQRAIDKLQSGDFGYCEGTGEAIPKRRLELAPWTRYSVKYKEQLERAMKSGRGVGDDDSV